MPRRTQVFVGVGPDVSHNTLTELAGRGDRVVLAPSFAALDDVPPITPALAAAEES